MNAPRHKECNAGAISLRLRNLGGGIAGTAQVSPPGLFQKASRIVVLIHGFNVDFHEADASYSRFERNLSEATRRNIVRVYWPGDASQRRDSETVKKGFLSRLLSGISYPVQPERADAIAQTLRECIRENINERLKRSDGQSKPLEIVLIAHSLGCFLTLRLLDRVFAFQGNAAEFSLVALMAAAVPRYSVEGKGSLAGLFRVLPRIWLFHSRRDRTLRWLFRPGEFFQRPGPGSWRPSQRTAIGRGGLPEAHNRSVVEGEWDHGEYWNDALIAEAVDASVQGRLPHDVAVKRLSRQVGERTVRARRAERREMAIFIPGL